MLTISPGYDPRYLTRQVGKGAENYYLSAVAEHGEPPGRWWGPGAEELGLEPGSEIDGRVMETLYSTFVDPRDPEFLNKRVADEEKTRLGRRPPKYDKAADAVYKAMLAAEPDADPERQKELLRQAKGSVQQAVMHHDATFSPPKSFTLLHAGLQAAAQEARVAGDLAQAEAYERAAAKVWDCVDAGAAASLQYLMEHAGTARRGSHSQVIDGRSTGKYIDAGGWVVARFRQHTNREGEPHLHIHQAILNRQLGSDGRWSALDSTALYRARPGAAAYGERVMYEQAVRDLGVELRARPDGNGFEIVGVTPEQIAAFSTRAAQVTDLTAEWIADYEKTHGRKPSARTVFQMAQYAGKLTKAKKLKLKDAPSRQAELAKWEKLTTEKELGLLSQIPAKALGRFTGRVAAKAARELAEVDYQKVLAAAVADAQASRSTFTRHEVLRHISRHLPAYLGGLPAEHLEALLEELTDAALDPNGPAAVRLLNAPDVIRIPEELQRADGTSVYQAPNFERYTTAAMLDTEAALTASAVAEGAPGLHPQQALEALASRCSAETFAAVAAEAGAEDVIRVDAAPAREGGLSEDQAAAVYGILTSWRRVDVLVGPAGAGKSFTVKQLADVWKETTGTRVVGLTTAQNAAYVLAQEGMDDTWNIARWLDRMKKGEIRLQRGQLVVVDEAGMVPTNDLARIQRYADAAGAKVVWAGDPAQLSAPEAGGMMRHLVEIGGAYELTSVKRFEAEWEGPASLRLRQGVEAVLDEYDAHGRLLEGDREEIEQAALQAYLADYLDGRQSVLLAPTNAKAAELAGMVREHLIELGLVERRGVTLCDEMGNAVNTAGAGDLIVARQNDQKVTIGQTTRQLSNRDVFVIEEVLSDGSVTARLVGKDGTLGSSVDLSSDYVRKHVELAYAGTVHSAQGRTVYRSYAVVDDTATRNMFYVMMTRGKAGNYAFIARDAARVADLRPGPEQAAGGPVEEQQRDKFAVLRGILERAEDSETATEAMLAEAQRPTHMAHLGAMLLGELRDHLADAYITSAEARGTLTPEEAARLRADEAKHSLGRLLWQIQMSGRDAEQILDRAIAERPLNDPADPAESLAKTLHWRITTAGEKRGLDVKTLEPSETAIGATWQARTPRVGDPAIDEFLAETALQMDVRQNVLGLEALDRAPAWMVEKMGQPPVDETERGEWAARAGAVLGYREMYGVVDEADPLGPEPSRQNPEQRAAWFAAHGALTGKKPGEVSKATLGELWSTRARYERELAWAPPYVADELQRVSIDARERAQEAVRLRAQAAAATGAERARLEAQAAGQQALADALAQRQALLEEVHAARVRWHEATKDLRVEALRADAELRRRDDVDAERLARLHGDHEADIAQELAADQQPAEVEPPIPGQLTIDGWAPNEHPAQQRREPETPERDPEEVLYARYAMARDAGRSELSPVTIAHALGTDDIQTALEAQERLRARYDQQRQQRATEQPEAEQIALDLFGAGEGSPAAAEQLTEAVERARAAAQVLKGRAVDARAAEEERVRRQAARPGPRQRADIARTQQRTAETRREMEARERGRRPQTDPQAAEAVRLARESFPEGMRPRLRRRDRAAEQQQQQQVDRPTQGPERGPTLGM